MENINFTLIDSLILDYAHIRRKTEMYKKRFPKYITGNDNYVGMIGEYWVTRFIEEIYSPDVIRTAQEQKENGNHSLSKEWYDFELSHNGKKEYINVKTIFEDKNGESGEIKYKEFDSNSIASVVVLKLDESLFPIELLYIKDLKNSLVNGMKDYHTNWNGSQPKSLIFKFYNSSKSYGFDRVFKNKDENSETNIYYFQESNKKNFHIVKV